MITDSMVLPLLVGVILILILGSLILVNSAQSHTRRSTFTRRSGHSHIDNQPGGCAWAIVTVLSIVVIACVLTWLRAPLPPNMMQGR